MLIGRKQEIKELENAFESDEAELIALYGRRRVGKTFLVNEVFGDRFSFAHSGLSPIEYAEDKSYKKKRMESQLLHFYHSLLKSGASKSAPPKSWLEAFYMLEDLLSSKSCVEKQVVFFDEIQWMDTPKSGFMTGFEAFWNGWASARKNIMVIVCGSSTSWVLDKFINNHGGLYGRLTKQIHLEPFTLLECEEFLASRGVIFSRYDILQTYMALGGIPYYLRYIDSSKSFAQNMDAIFFAKGAPLDGEFKRLFRSIFANYETMEKIIKSIYSRKIGLTRQEIIAATGIADSGAFSKYLEALIEGGFIMIHIPFGFSKMDKLYKLVDPFCLFYLRFMGEAKKINCWSQSIEAPEIVSWRGLAFENVCFNHVKAIKASLGIAGVSTQETLLWKRGDEKEKGAQIDMIIDRKDNVVDLCEAKFSSDLFAVDKDYHFRLVERAETVRAMLPKKKSLHNILITTYGIKKNEYAWDFQSVVTMDDLFRPQ